MGRFTSLFKKDVLLGFKDVFILLEVGFAVVISLIIAFVVPEDIETEAAVFIYDQTAVVEDFVREFYEEPPEEVGESFVNSRREVVDGMVENRSAVGLIISESGEGAYTVEMLKQPYTTDGMVEYVKLDLEDLLTVLDPPAGIYPQSIYESVEIRALQEGRRDEIPFNQRLVPVVLLMMVGIIGLFAMVSLVGQERGDKTIRAYRVSPAGLITFITSKHLMLLAVGFVTFSIIYLPTIGFEGYLPALAVMVATILLGSALGVILGSFFEEAMSAIGWVFLFMILLGLPAVSLFNPVFSPEWLKAIPSYHTLFGLDAAMFPDGNSHIIRRSVAILAGIDLVLVPLSGWIFTARIGKEA